MPVEFYEMIRRRNYSILYLIAIYIATITFVHTQNSPALVPSCNPNPCRHNGRCVTNNGQNFCKCEVGFVGSSCQFADPCNPSQCQNGGTCNVIVNDVQGPRFTCSCPVGYTASLCEIPLPNACDKSACLNHGTCQLITLNQSRCICPNGYLGEHCEILDHCASEPCKNGATCISSSLTDKSGPAYQCHCADGFQGQTCTDDIDECANPSKNPCVHGTCVNVAGSYRCDCRQGYTGKNCDQIYVPCDPSPCQNGGQCIVFGQFKYFCQCPAGFTGKNCEQNIDDCVGHLCQNGGKCVDGLNGYTCNCPPTYRGKFCTEDVDECSENKYMCQNGGTCQNTVGGFHCICVNGWEGKFCQINHDDCERQQCFNGGTCIDRVATFSCNCTVGWTGLLCHLRDACMSSPCQGRGKCDTNPVDGGYLCSCASGFKGGDCSLDIDECANGNPCEHQGTCVNTPGSYRCECTAGWTGQFCDQNINECASHPCQNDATCLDDEGRFLCVCRPGFTGLYCEINLNDRLCASAPCLNGGHCRSNPNGFTCECLNGFSGDRCQTNINECASHPCENNATCIDGIGKYSCSCLPGFTGIHCETSLENRACVSGPCLNSGRCRANKNGFTCECPAGFKGDRCQVDEDDCASNPCRNGATCKDGSNSFTCKCALGFSGKICDVNDNDCTPSSCLNGGTCLDGINNFTCQCARGYRGRHCELVDNLDGLYKEVELKESEMCRLNNCDKKADDGTCNPECNYFACRFDGDDCSAGLKPFQKCPIPCYCWHRFQDGTCDPECNNEACLFDGYDCTGNKNENCNPLYVAYCTSHFRDGKCDSGCNTPGCNFDGGDCDADDKIQTHQQLQGSIVMIVTVEPEIFINNSNRFLMVVGKIVDATVTIQQDDTGRLMIYRWNSRDGVDKTAPVASSAVRVPSGRGKRQTSTPAPFLTGTLVVLTVDISRCVTAGRTDCFKEIVNVADFLGAASAKEALRQSLGWDVYSISASGEQPPTNQDRQTIVVIASVLSAASLIFLTIYVLVRKRKIRAPIWVPEILRSDKPDADAVNSGKGSNGLASFERCAIANQYEPDFKRSSCASVARKRSEFHQTSASVYSSQLGDYLNWNDNHSRRESYSQCSDNETYSTYAESQCTGAIAATPLPQDFSANIPPAKKPKMAISAKEPEKQWTQEHNDVAFNPVDRYRILPTSNVNVKGPDNLTPLMISAKLGRMNEMDQVKICLDLIQHGASLNEQTEIYNDSALIFAVKHCRPHLVRNFVQAGADTNLADAKGCTPLHHAVGVCSKEMVEILLENRQTNVDAVNDDMRTPLIWAAMLSSVGDTEIISVLLSAGAKVCCKDKDGRSALHWAAMTDNAAAVELLLRKGADKDSQDEKDQTPLFLAAKEGNFDAAKRLLEMGANKDITDQLDRLPKDMAIERDQKQIVQLLDTPPALWTTLAPLHGKSSYEYAGTLPHNFDGNRSKSRNTARTKSMRDTSGNGRVNLDGTKTEGRKGKKKTPEKTPVSDSVTPAMPIIAAPVKEHFQMIPASIKQPTPPIPQRQNSHPAIVISPCYLDQTTPPSLPYQSQLDRPQPITSQRSHAPLACSFSPPQCAAPGGANVASTISYNSLTSYPTGGGGNFYHRSPEAGTCYVQSPPPHPQTRLDTAVYNFGSSCGQQAPPTSQQQRHHLNVASTPGYTQWPPQNTAEYIDYQSSNGAYEYDTTAFQSHCAHPGSTAMQESDLDGYYQHYQRIQQPQQMWAPADMYHT